MPCYSQVFSDSGTSVCGHCGEWGHDQGSGWLHSWTLKVINLFLYIVHKNSLNCVVFFFKVIQHLITDTKAFWSMWSGGHFNGYLGNLGTNSCCRFTHSSVPLHGIDSTSLFCFYIRPKLWIVLGSWYYFWYHLHESSK